MPFRDHYEFEKEIKSVEEGFQILKIELDNLDIFNVYRSSNGSKEVLCSRLRDLIDTAKKTVIFGDFNICALSERNNSVTRLLRSYGFIQIVKEASHIRGRAIDHIYIKNDDYEAIVDLERCSPYYTDHDAFLLTL